MESVNPHNGKVIASFKAHSSEEIETKLSQASHAFLNWRKVPIVEKSRLLRSAAQVMRGQKSRFAMLMAEEMGKPLKDGEGEIEKCALTLEYYANEGGKFLEPELIPSEYQKSWIQFEPLGPVLAIMPWNFPFWQVIRFAAPNLLAGNVGVLKHASNVSACSLALEAIFREAGFPEGVFTSLLIEGKSVDHIIESPHIKAVTLTGSTPAGKAVASAAGKVLKKCVLELGGSDAYIILADADVQAAAKICAQSRLINGGQSCIAAKRFLVVKDVRQEFEEAMKAEFLMIKVGDPQLEGNSMGPLARKDLCDQLHKQVQQSIKQGARLLLGGEKFGPEEGAYYLPTILSKVKPGMVAFDEELFGPVAAIIEVENEEEAIQLANQSIFGLGAAIFSRDLARAEKLAEEIEAGSVFINGFVKSDPRLPFGGIKESGYGRELSSYGIREFLNIKTVVRP